MEIILPLVVGFCISFVATLLPGLLNITTAKIGIKEGRRNAVFFALGAATIVFFQAYISVTFAKLINRSPEIVNMLQEAGLVIFTLLTIYFLFLSKKKKAKINPDEVHVRSTTGNYFLGIMLSALNFFPIPYYVFVSVSLMASGELLSNNFLIFLFVFGAVMGSFAVFYLYIVFFKKFEHKTHFFISNVNFFIGSITGLISIITLIKLLRNH
jgi:threonine/homoserine/homoserine lactone efflux protein